MNSEVRVELRIMDFDCSPIEITSLLGMEPTKIWVKGAPFSKTGEGLRVHQENGWAWRAMSSSPFLPSDFGVLFDDFLRAFSPIGERFAHLSSKVSVQLACCAYVGKQSPAFSLPESLVKLLSQINASVDLDIYCLAEKGEF